MSKYLTKLTEVLTNNKIYVNLSAATLIQEYQHDSHYSTNGICGPVKGTRILVNGYDVVVSEHIAEILAHIEGRDPAPARVMFGKKEEE